MVMQQAICCELIDTLLESEKIKKTMLLLSVLVMWNWGITLANVSFMLTNGLKVNILRAKNCPCHDDKNSIL
jgi:hypothetical protein